MNEILYVKINIFILFFLCYTLNGDDMKKINKMIDKNINKIFIIFLCIQPIIDVLTAVMLNVFHMDFTIGVIIRVLFLFFMIYYLFFINHNKDRKKAILYVVIILIYMTLFSVNILYTKGISALGYELKSLVKTFYFPILLVVIYEMFQKKKNIIKPKFLKNLFIIYGLLVFVPNILGIGFDSYAVTKSGSIGWFYTANEISAIISILMPIFIYIVLEKKNYTFIAIAMLILIYILTSMGTKGPLLSFLIIILYYLVKYIYVCIKRKKYKPLAVIATTLIGIVFLIVLFIPKTNFYKNIVVHLNFLEVKSVSDIVTNPKVIDHFIFSERLTFWKNTHNVYKKSNLTSKLVGIGYIDNYSTDQVSMKTVEMDYVDIFYRHGMIGFVLYMGSFFYMLIKIIRKYFQYSKMNNRNKIVQAYMLSLVLSTILALLTGHVLTSPSVSIFVALIFNLFYNELYKGGPKNDKVGNGHS